MDIGQTIVAISSPPGAGGVALLRLSGPEVRRVVERCFTPLGTKVKTDLRNRHAYFGHWHRPDQPGEVLDEVLVTFFYGPRSYTGEDVAEVSCHGSRYIQRVVLEAALDAGAQLAGPGEFTQRAFVNGRLDLTQAEGVADLIAAESQAAHRLALQQMKGGMSAAMQKLRSRLIGFASLLELENDFGEEDVEFADRRALSDQLEETIAHITELIDSFARGRVIKEGVTVALVGRPNAGKSSLLNVLAGEERAIVSEVAGTTRDTIDALVDIEGVRFRLVDTAGLRDTADTVEQIGISRAYELMKRADIIVYLLDAAVTSDREVQEDLARLPQEVPRLVVQSKMDQGTASPAVVDLGLSSRTGEGLEILKQELFERSVGSKPRRGDVILTQARHATKLSEAREALERTRESLELGLPSDLMALDLRQALHAVGEVTGQISTDDLLDVIFRDFCIGK